MAEDRASRKHIPNVHARELFRKYREWELSPNPQIREGSKKGRLDMVKELRKGKASWGEWHKYQRVALPRDRYTKDEILERARSKR